MLSGYFSTCAVLFLLSISALSSPTPNPSTKEVQYVDTFNKLQSTAVNNEVNFVDNHAGGALSYQAFAVGSTASFAAVRTDGNVIFSQLVQQTVEGPPAFYINNTVQSFDLKKLDYAIIVNLQNAAVTSVQSGTIQLTGTKVDGSTVKTNINFTEPLLTIPGTLQSASLPASFSNLKRVDIKIIKAQVSTSPALATFFFDNVAYVARFAR